jgi:hypothetical protein
LAVSAAATDGLKMTLIVQELLAATVEPHVAVAVKSVSAAVGAPPETTALVNAIAAAEPFVSVTVLGAVAVPTG